MELYHKLAAIMRALGQISPIMKVLSKLTLYRVWEHAGKFSNGEPALLPAAATRATPMKVFVEKCLSEGQSKLVFTPSVSKSCSQEEGWHISKLETEEQAAVSQVHRLFITALPVCYLWGHGICPTWRAVQRARIINGKLRSWGLSALKGQWAKNR